MADIHVLLSQIRANAGDVIAQQDLDEIKRTEVNLTLESLCAIMQLESNRIQTGISKKMDNQQIGEYIKTLVDQRILDLITQYQAEKELISQYFEQYSETQYHLMSPAGQTLWIDIHDLDIRNNFEPLALMLKDFSFQDSNRIFSCLLIQTVHDQLSRKIAIPCILC